MKTFGKNILIVVLLSAAFSGVHAQLYMGLGAGYGMPALKDWFGGNNTYDGTTHTYQVVNSSLGKGILPALYVGYKFNDHFGAELNYSYLLGSKITTSDKYNPNAGTSQTTDEDYTLKMMRIGPGVRYSIGDGMLRPYMRMGMIFGVGAKMIYNYNETDVNGSVTSTDDETWEFTGNLTIGYNGALGVIINFSDKVGVYAEVGMIYQQWAPAKMVATKYAVNGTDQLPNMNKMDKETDFSDKVTTSSTPDPNSPSQSTTIYFPVSSWGFNVGAHFSFGGGK